MLTFSSSDFLSMEKFFFSGVTKSYNFRRKQLLALKDALKRNEEAIMDALYKDLHRSFTETYTTEIGFLYAEINFILKHLKSWMKVVSKPTPLVLFQSSSKIMYEPLAVVLIIGPWNYPLQLLLAPLAGAIAGGNCAVLKPSEFTQHTNAVIRKMISEAFSKEYITMVEGEGAEVVPQLIKENKFDHVFFTGSITIGKEIAKLAAEKLIPTTLELGGKSPCIVDKEVNIRVAAQRIAWGKFTNAGQTCVAPDYVLVHEKRKDELLDAIQNSIKKFYGAEPKLSPDYARIINKKRFDILESYLHQGDIITGGVTDENELYISPTIIKNVAEQQPLMQEEIFGPILPIITYAEQEEVLQEIRKHPQPLSLYVFSDSTFRQKFYIENISFGGGCINNTLVHLANSDLPFGGIGNSGSGTYHGSFSFYTFTRPKPVLKTATWFDPSIKYPPYEGKMKFFRRFME
ncbi:MAG: aldehyde dehydrogenase family protein [Ilyomonas sp.]